MLLPHQVIHFLQHEESFVRGHAATYLASAHDPSPATAEEIWEMIDRFGAAGWRAPTAYLADMPQTPASLQRTLAGLREERDEDRVEHLHRVLERLDFPLLQAHHEEILAEERVSQDVKEHARASRAGGSSGRGADRLMEHGQQCADKNAGEIDSGPSDRLVEAIARTGDRGVLERAWEILNDDEIADWREIF